MNVNFQIAKQFKNKIDKKELTNIIDRTVDILNIEKGSELTIIFIGNDKMIDLNSKYRKINSTTDVLSFSSNETNPESGNRYIGDIVISFPQALQQAVESDLSVDTEIAQLTIHGLLHLTGFDHQTRKEKITMFALQEKIMREACKLS